MNAKFVKGYGNLNAEFIEKASYEKGKIMQDKFAKMHEILKRRSDES